MVPKIANMHFLKFTGQRNLNLKIISRVYPYIAINIVFLLFYSHRHRRTEKEEDEEMLEEGRHAQTHIIQFTESPTCE